MQFWIWEDHFRLGVHELDEQHKTLIALMSQLHGAIAEGQAKAMLAPLFVALLDYTKEHFADEANLMNAYDYPEAADHVIEHAELINRIRALQQEYERGSILVTLNTARFLGDWLSYHILVSDRNLADFLRNKGVS
jgi:hemerythrin-like metal-binding protein